MKHLYVIFAFLFASLSLLPGPVFAVDEAGAAAELNHPIKAVLPDERVTRLRAFLQSHDSPLADQASTFVAEADRNNLDWKLVAAIAGVESTFGREIPPGSYNGWGWGIPTGAQSGVGFGNWEQGIATVSEGLSKNYFGRGAKTIYDVGWIYAANGNSWGSHVVYFLNKIQAFQPVSPAQLAVSI